MNVETETMAQEHGHTMGMLLADVVRSRSADTCA